eukprot:CAMPEP_0182453758 /NCGR_PEP_ID=MMETSP1319-20130603/685_1 /TAXON_ID=172717 /ORGANISM="Bolidomonas pacifica, Strain RCC208" /LENGTH=384 /DNA_ID=CAMNT_0024651713 /DNA_START=172 /DNA_END=1326 /DNA_ORIENTATION=+
MRSLLLSRRLSRCLPRRRLPSPFLLSLPRLQSTKSRAPPPSQPDVFDRPLKLLQRDNAHRLLNSLQAQPPSSDPDDDPRVSYSYIRDEVASRLVSRLEDCKDRDFELCLDLGAGSGHVLRAVNADVSLSGNGGGVGGVRKIVQVEGSGEAVKMGEEIRTPGPCSTYVLPSTSECVLPLPFPSNSFDLVISSLSLHSVNDIPSTLSEAYRVLKPDGALFLAMPGGETLPELRSSLLLAETERDGGVSVRVGPFVDVSDVGSLLQRSGFKLPTVDVDTISVTYPNMYVLMEHLQRMGESNAAVARREAGARGDLFLAAAAVYGELFPWEGGEEGEEETDDIVASMQVIYAIGWKEHESQQVPDERGTASKKIGEIVEVDRTEPGGK